MIKPDETPKRIVLRKAGDADINPATPASSSTEDASRLWRGGTTGDAVGAPDKDKQVDLEVKVPKSLRKSLRREAARAGVSLDVYVAEILRSR